MFVIHTHFKKSKKRKPNAKQRQLAADWEKLLAKYEPKKPIKATKVLDAPKPFRRETPVLPSLGGTGSCTVKPTQQYTGDSIIGIATMHKSNAVPVFSQEDAKEISRMRRG